jgi:Zn-finger nucleic acid-binding protein
MMKRFVGNIISIKKCPQCKGYIATNRKICPVCKVRMEEAIKLERGEVK